MPKRDGRQSPSPRPLTTARSSKARAQLAVEAVETGGLQCSQRGTAADDDDAAETTAMLPSGDGRSGGGQPSAAACRRNMCWAGAAAGTALAICTLVARSGGGMLPAGARPAAAAGVCIFDVDMTLTCGGDCPADGGNCSTAGGGGCVDTAITRGYRSGFPLRFNAGGAERLQDWCAERGFAVAIATHGNAAELLESHGGCSGTKLGFACELIGLGDDCDDCLNVRLGMQQGELGVEKVRFLHGACGQLAPASAALRWHPLIDTTGGPCRSGQGVSMAAAVTVIR